MGEPSVGAEDGRGAADLTRATLRPQLAVAPTIRAYRLRGLRAVRLSGADTHPRTQALYQRLGFRPVGSGSLGSFAAIYGFDRCTTMERRTSG